MTLQKVTPLVLIMFTVVCALPATVVSPPLSAIAQEDNEEDNLAGGTVSNVLDNVNTAADNTDTQLSVPLIDQGQTDANLGLSEALDVIEEEPPITPITPTPPEEGEEEEPPEFVAFCNEFSSVEVHCYQSLEDCVVGEGLFNVQDPDCEGVETIPTGDLVGLCRVESSPQGELFAVCSF